MTWIVARHYTGLTREGRSAQFDQKVARCRGNESTSHSANTRCVVVGHQEAKVLDACWRAAANACTKRWSRTSSCEARVADPVISQGAM